MKREDKFKPIPSKWSYNRPLEPICLALDEISEGKTSPSKFARMEYPFLTVENFQRIKEKRINYMKKRIVEMLRIHSNLTPHLITLYVFQFNFYVCLSLLSHLQYFSSKSPRWVSHRAISRACLGRIRRNLPPYQHSK